MKKGLIFIFSSILILGTVVSVNYFFFSTNKVLGANNQNLIIRRVEPNDDNKLVALTFDDGPAPITLDILKVLDENDVLATFFVTGQNIDLYKEVLSETYQKGHEIGNHTNTHPF
ncbi:MAG: polysaccharide deacetylase family protein, partial [Candidatus Pacebacteria bacterium]|nr:polysaccharide deacetylase family protein [Candidatus Paceibacterota bacterium]